MDLNREREQAMEKVRYAVVGLRHGMEHIDVGLKNSRVEVVALCDRDTERTKQAVAHVRDVQGADVAGKISSFDDYQRMLAWGEFDAVIISTPVMAHKEMAIQAVKAQKHVLLEKPMTVTLAEALELRAACQGSRTICQVGYEVRSSQLVRKVMELIRSGKIGDVVFVWWHSFLMSEVRGWRSERKNMGGKLFDCCCHYWDILQLFAGARFHRVSAFGNKQGGIGPNADTIPNVATVNFEYQNGVKGNLSSSEISPTPETSLFGVVGTNGIIYGNPWRPEGAGSLDCYSEGCLYREQITINGTMASCGHLGFREQHDAFLNSILQGAPVVCTVDDGYEVVLLNTAVDQSIATGNVIFRDDLARS